MKVRKNELRSIRGLGYKTMASCYLSHGRISFVHEKRLKSLGLLREKCMTNTMRKKICIMFLTTPI